MAGVRWGKGGQVGKKGGGGGGGGGQPHFTSFGQPKKAKLG